MWPTIKMPPLLNGLFRSPMIRGLLGLVVLILPPIGATGLGDEIHAAAQDGDLPKVKMLLQAHPGMVSRPGPFGATPLHLAAAFGCLDIAELLLTNQADIKATTAGGKTPLHWAAAEGRTNIVQLLLAHNAPVNARDHNGNTPLHDAALNGRKVVVALLLQNSAEVNVHDAWGWTPLHFAVVAGDLEEVDLLLRHQAEINAKGFLDHTPLCYANDAKLAGWLRQHGAVE